jgi:hypothetical protein
MTSAVVSSQRIVLSGVPGEQSIVISPDGRSITVVAAEQAIAVLGVMLRKIT